MLELYSEEDDKLEDISKSLHLDQYTDSEKPSKLLKKAFFKRIKRLESLLKDSSLSAETRQDYLTEIKILTED
jgi:hypothetical protein